MKNGLKSAGEAGEDFEPERTEVREDSKPEPNEAPGL